MKSLAERARQRITGWMATNRQITQATIAAAVGVSQSWVSLYKSGGVEADLDQLDAIAGVFGHTLNELLDLRPDPDERDLVDAYRAIAKENRPVAVRSVQAMAGLLPPPPPRKRAL